MQSAVKKETKLEKWRNLVEGSEGCSGSLHDYCKEQSISYFQLSYWRKKLRKGKKEVRLQKSRRAAASGFVPLKIQIPEIGQPNRSQALHLPDAKWTAEVLFNLVRMTQ